MKIRQQVLGLDFAPDTLSVLVFSSMFIDDQRFYTELYWRLRKPIFLLRYGQIGKYKRTKSPDGRFTESSSSSSSASSSSRDNIIVRASSSSTQPPTITTNSRLSSRASTSPRAKRRRQNYMSNKESKEFANKFRDLPNELFQHIVLFVV